jgi:hypothetical protein|tara:strand:+ start:274 stop:978 length:705 start_codon:yes stop_codon:yes gene_type:complete
MGLPKLNSAKYELSLPSTGATIKYRPFLVKEQKALMIAQESEDDKVIESTFAQIINDCVADNVDPYKMPMFDIEYVFLKIRGKSVGEVVDLKVTCPDDEETQISVSIPLDEVKVQMSETHTNVVTLSNDISVIMRYPCLGDMKGFNALGETKSLFEMIKRCIHEVHDGEEVYHRVDMSEKDLEDFIDSMSSKNFESIGEFFTSMPKLSYDLEIVNPKTKVKSVMPIEGLQSFFE